MLKAYLCLCAQESLHEVFGRGSNWGQIQAKQVPESLYYLSGQILPPLL